MNMADDFATDPVDGIRRQPGPRSKRGYLWAAAIIAVAIGAVVLARSLQARTDMPTGVGTGKSSTRQGGNDQSILGNYQAAHSFLINGDFELASDRKSVDNWTVEGEAEKIPTRSGTYSVYGNWSLRLVDNTRKSQAEVFQDVTSPVELAGKPFTVYTWLRLPEGAPNRKVTIRVVAGASDYTYQPVVTDKWELYSYTATIQDATREKGTLGTGDDKVTNLRLILNVSSPGDMKDKGEAYFDGTKLVISDSGQ